MIIDCIGCLHGARPSLDGGDLLIVTGDVTARDTKKEFHDFVLWLLAQDYYKIILIAGNHDNELKNLLHGQQIGVIEYLCDCGTEFDGFKIWGSPWTKSFEGMNSKCKAFTCDTEKQLEEKWKIIPKDTNILVTHTPPHGILDGIPQKDGSIFHVGSESLHKYADWDAGLGLHVFSHIHEGYGEYKESNMIFSAHAVNCSIMNERYQPVNAPIRVIL